MNKNWITIAREVFPDARIIDAALEYPRTASGWSVETIPPESITDDKLIINLQDHLTYDSEYEFPVELEKLWLYYGAYSNLNYSNIIVITECPVLNWPSDRFPVIHWSAFLYEDWCANKSAEDLLRTEFADAHRSLEFNTVCPMRHDRPHRSILYSRLDPSLHNVSLQSKGFELNYPNISFTDYEDSYDNLQNLLSLKRNYLTAGFVTVAESQYSVTHGVITEKTMQAIIAGMPFFVLGHRGILGEIRELGFRTFAGIVDEDYDECSDVGRLDCMLTLNRNVFDGLINRTILGSIINDCREITEYNREYYFTEFGNHLITNLRQQLLNLWGD